MPDNCTFTDNEIKALTDFQESFFESEILRLKENISIRLANYFDCSALSLLKKELWETTYRGIYPNEKIDNYNYIENEIKFKNFIDNPQQYLYVVLDNDKIIGYFEFGVPFRAFQNYKQEIGLLYLKKEYQRTGIGKILFYFSFNNIKNAGVDKFFISCHKYNLNAQKFYKKMGGKVVQVDDDSDNNGLPHIKYEYTIK